MRRKSLFPELLGALAVTGTLLVAYLAVLLVMEGQVDHGGDRTPGRVPRALNSRKGPAAGGGAFRVPSFRSASPSCGRTV